MFPIMHRETGRLPPCATFSSRCGFRRIGRRHSTRGTWPAGVPAPVPSPPCVFLQYSFEYRYGCKKMECGRGACRQVEGTVEELRFVRSICWRCCATKRKREFCGLAYFRTKELEGSSDCTPVKNSVHAVRLLLIVLFFGRYGARFLKG